MEAAAVLAETGRAAREGESSEEEGQIIDDDDDEPMEAERSVTIRGATIFTYHLSTC